MPEYKLFITDEFSKQLRKLDHSVQKRLNKKLDPSVYDQLKDEPHFGKNIKKLVGYDPETWRYRIGDFRLFYIIDKDNKVVALISIDNRKNAY